MHPSHGCCTFFKCMHGNRHCAQAWQQHLTKLQQSLFVPTSPDVACSQSTTLVLSCRPLFRALEAAVSISKLPPFACSHCSAQDKLLGLANDSCQSYNIHSTVCISKPQCCLQLVHRLPRAAGSSVPCQPPWLCIECLQVASHACQKLNTSCEFQQAMLQLLFRLASPTIDPPSGQLQELQAHVSAVSNNAINSCSAYAIC